MSEKTAEELQHDARVKLDFLQQEYWRVRNGKKQHVRCPYCLAMVYPGDDPLCCDLFAKGLKAILDRQDEVDKGMQMASQVQRMLNGYVQ
jgi:hypothetical protein